MIRLSLQAKRHLKEALAEDIGKGDRTSNLLVPGEARARAVILAREKGVFCGAPVLAELFRLAGPGLKAQFLIPEGRFFSKNQTVIRLSGKTRSLLKVERTALNFLGRLSGIATLAHLYAECLRGTKAKIYDTRKTTPLLREFEKYAVKTGGGKNHRFGLYDFVLVKENHRKFGRLSKLRSLRGKFEIEVRNRRELLEALALKPAVILFDNFSPGPLKKAVQIARKKNPRILLEASGGITPANVRRFAAAGVDRISAGSLTHSARAIDFSLLIR